MKGILTTALIIAGALSGLGQELPGEVTRDPDAGVETYGIRVLGPNDAVALPAPILSIVLHEDGADVLFVGEENRNYMLWASDDGKEWREVAIAGCVDPGLYMAHDETAQGAESRLYNIVEMSDERPFTPQEYLQRLMGMVGMQEELTPEQRAAFAAAAAQLVQAKQALVAECNEVARVKKCVADCLAEVMRLRLAAQQAEAEAKKAEDEVARLEEPLEEIDDQLADLARERRELEEFIEQMEEQWKSGTRLMDEYRQRQAATNNPGESAALQDMMDNLRRNMDKWIAERKQAQEELRKVKEKEAELRAQGEAMLPALEAARAEARAKREAADGARKAYEDARKKCDDKKQALQDAEDRKKQAAAQAQQAGDDFENARSTAAQQVDDNRAAREAAAAAAQTETERRAAAEEEARMQAAQEQARRELEQSLHAWKCFFDFIRETAGQQEAERIADGIGGAWWDSIKAFGVLKGIFKGLARGQSVGAMVNGAAMSGMQVGYGILVNYAKQKMVNALKNILGGTTAKWLKEIQDGMKPGESKAVKFSNSVHVLVKTAEGEVYVFSWSNNYFTSGGTYREDVFID